MFQQKNQYTASFASVKQIAFRESNLYHLKLGFNLTPWTTRPGVWTSKTRTSLVHWTSQAQNFFLTLHTDDIISIQIWIVLLIG